MLDIKELRTNLEDIKLALSKRGQTYPLDEILEFDKNRLSILRKLEEMRARQNSVSKEIPKLKKAGEDIAEIMLEMKSLSDDIKEQEPLIRELEGKIENMLLSIPNIPNASVLPGDNEELNQEVRVWGEPTKFEGYEPKSHWDLGNELGILDPVTAAKTTGSRFTFYKGAGARLERALINFMLNTHLDKHGYTEVLPPYIVHRRSLVGTGQLPKFEEDQYKLEGTDYFLNPTAEVSITNMYREEILENHQLPIYHTAYSPSFRSEAGSAGRDTRGIIRQHQFNKVELVKFVHQEDSYAELEKLTNNAEAILQLLNLPYRVMKLCAGDMGFCAAMCYDLEVWMPSYGRYVEISSCSNFEAFQARRADIRYRDAEGQIKFVHTLNGSGLAVGRTTAAIIENFQDKSGSVHIPEVLQGYMGGIESIICK